MSSDAVSANSLSKTLCLGLVGFVVVMLLAIVVFSLFSVSVFTSWVGYLFMCATPAQVIIALLWKTNYPSQLQRLAQPIKGLVLLAMTIGAGLIVAILVYYLVGSGVGAPTPMLNMYIIMSVVVSLWLIPVWHCWPISRFSDHPGVVGIVALIAVYFIAYGLFNLLFDFSFLSAAPFYSVQQDPQGLFNAWAVLSCSVTTVSIVMALVLLDFRPVQKIVGTAGQPWAGIVSTVIIAVLATALYCLFTVYLSFDRVDYLVRVPVCFIFGVFIVNNLMRHQLLISIAQPLRGVCLIVCAILCTLLIYQLYVLLACVLNTDALLSGAPTYELEVWIATATLGVTFPIIITVSEYFQFWPIISNKDEPESQSSVSD